MSLRLLYHLITTHERIVKAPEKLRVFPGGFQKYQLCLARLNFFDDGVLEAGIGSDVPMLALEPLEGAVTMEEADAIHEPELMAYTGGVAWRGGCIYCLWV
jgi:hypothetical protein